MTRVLRSLRVCALAAGVLPFAAMAAQSDRDPRLGRLDGPTREAVRVLVDSARAAKLPTEPLVDKALEGAQKGADGPRIVGAVRGLSGELRNARGGLGATATADEITAGAHALHAGLQPRDLAQLRAAAQRTGRHRVTMPLTVAADLVARAVPAATASEIVLTLTRSGVRDAELSVFQRNVRLDIERGADPGTAAQTRARGVLLHTGRTS